MWLPKVWDLGTVNGLVCRTAVVLVVATMLCELLRSGQRREGWPQVAAELALPVTAVAFVVRLLAPFGPLINSGRDLRYLDDVVHGPSHPHTHLMAALLWPVRACGDPLRAFELGQLALGASNAGLVALLAYGLCRRRLPAMTAGLLAAVLVVLARVDASPNAMVALRTVLLGTILLALRYLRSQSIVSLVGVGAGLVALAYGRLEAPLLSGLVLTWLAIEQPPGAAAPGRAGPLGRPGLVALCAVLATTMLAALLHRLLLPIMAVLVLAMLWRRRGAWPLSRHLVGLGLACALALVPRAMEISALERETASRFPSQLLLLFGKTNILLFDAALCTPLCAILVGLGLWKGRTAEGAVMRYASVIAIPTLALALLFMGNASARMKLQGLGILLLLPLAGLGAEPLVARLARRWPPAAVWWAAAAAGIVASAALPGFAALRSATSLDREYALMSTLGERVRPGTVVHALPRAEELSLLCFPRVLQDRAGIRVVLLDLQAPPQLAPGELVWLGAGCRRFREGEVLPGLGRTLADSFLAYPRWSTAEKIARTLADKDGTLQQVFDALPVTERDQCTELRRRYELVEHDVTWVRRGSLDGHWMPRRLPVGLYRVTRP